MICDVCDEANGQHCDNCGTDSCDACRKKLGSGDRCPNCGMVVAQGRSCSVTGGCGDGSQEEP